MKDYVELCRISRIRPFISVAAANKLIVAFVLLRRDCCNSLLAGLVDVKFKKLQRMQNNAARLVFKQPKHVHVRPLLRSLRCLSVKARIEYKLSALCCQCLNCNTTPSYLSELINPYVPFRSLRSQDAFLLSVLRISLAMASDHFLILNQAPGILSQHQSNFVKP